ncbi:MAG: hypothetical protein ACR2LQ_13585 [Acidimicrobiales bacterium]
MCAVCFTAAEMVPAVAAAGRAMIVKRTMRKVVADAGKAVEPVEDERVLSSV